MENHYPLFQRFYYFPKPRFKTVLAIVFLLHGYLVSAQSWNPVGTFGFSAGSASWTRIAIDKSGIPYVVFSDGANSNKATVMSYNGTSWVIVGSAGFSAGEADYTSIAIDTSGMPYVAYEDVANGNGATVMKYNGTSWSVVGNAAFSAAQATYVRIAFDGNNTPYVGYSDICVTCSSGPYTVMKFNGTTWVAVGATGFGGSGVFYTSFAVNKSGTPYAAFVQDGCNKTTVMKYDGSSWTTVGSSCFSPGTTSQCSLALDTAGAPYLVTSDEYYSYWMTANKYNGSSWETVGTPGFGAETYEEALAIGPSGTPYVFYTDAIYGGYATVTNYNGSNWVSTGSPYYIGGSTNYPDIAIDGSGSPFIVFQHNDGTTYSAVVLKYGSLPSPITGGPFVCAGATTLLHDITAGGIWSSDNTAIASIGSGTGVVTGVAAGSATISYTVGGQSTTILISVNPMPSAGTITGVSGVCVGVTDTLTDTVAGGVWSSSNTANATVSDTGAVTGISAGSAVITYTITNTCGTAYVTKTLTVNPLPAAGTISGASNVCVASSIPLTDGSAGGSWSSSYPLVATVGSTGIVTGVSPGNDTISYTVTNGCGVAVAHDTVTVRPLPFAGVISGPSDVCDSLVITLNDTAIGGTWSAANIAASVAGGIVTGVHAGIDTITYTVTNSCGTALATKVVTVSLLPQAGAIIGPDSVCVDATITLTDGTGGGTWHSSGVSATITGGVATGTSAGSSTIMYVVTNLCASDTARHIVSVHPLPNPGIISGNDSLCPGDTITLSETIAGGTWSTTHPLTATISSAGLIAGISPGLDSIIYTVTLNGCVSTTVYPFIVSPYSICLNYVPQIQNQSGRKLSIYPNPANDFFTIFLASPDNESGNVVITNEFGARVKAFTFETNKAYEVVLDAPPGVYYLFSNVAGELFEEKITLLK